MYKTPTRNHISVIAERLGFFFFFLIVIAANALQQALQEAGGSIFTAEFWKTAIASADSGGYVLLAAVAFLLITVVVLVLSLLFWRKTFFYISEPDFVYEKRTLFKKTSRLPIQNIATVNIERNVFERIIGTAKVKLDLNSSHTADKTDFSFVLKLADAENLRSALLSLKQEKRTDDELYETQADYSAAMNAALEDELEELVSFSTLQAFRHVMLSIPFMRVFLAVFAFAAVPFSSEEDFSWQSLAFVAAIAIVGGIYYIISGTLNLADYRVRTDGKNIYITCGKLKKASYTFEKSRINAVFVCEPVLARVCGLSSIEIAVVGLGNEKNETPRLTLLSGKSDTDRILSLCADDFLISEPPIRSHPCALISSAVRSLIFPAILFFVLYFFSPATNLQTWLCSAALFAVILLRGFLSYKTKSIAANDDVFRYTTGVFSRRSGMFKYGDIQSSIISTNLFMRPFATGRLELSILSSSRMKNHKTGWFKTELLDRAAERMAQSEDTSVTYFNAS